MIPRECKRLAEVDFPIAAVSRHAVREKSIRHGHPSTLHLWWARRPLASSRAVLMALLLPDPCDPHCPEEFRHEARRILLRMHGRPKGWTAEVESNEGLRRIILQFVANFANWDRAADRTYVKVSRALVKAAHGADAPLVVDPFAGGGSIPLEALRLGCEAFASDLNPVACLILKVMLEDIPRHGPKLADALRRAGGEVRRQAERKLADLYPADPDGATPIAYLWARTVRCEAPNCGAEIPLMRSFWLCKKAKRKRALRHRIERPRGEAPRVEFEVYEPESDRDVRTGTVTRAKATCLCCGAVLPPERVRAQLGAERGGADVIFDTNGSRSGGARMTAVVTLRPGEKGRHYRLPAETDYAAVHRAQARIAGILDEWERDLPGAQAGGRQRPCPVPDEPLNPIRPSPNARGLSAVTRYGMATFGDLFAARQKVALVELGRLVRNSEDNDEEQQHSATRRLLSIAVDKTADLGNALAPWKPDAECPVHLLARQAIGMAWDFCESVPPCYASGSFVSAYLRSADALEPVCGIESPAGEVQSADATNHPLPDQAAAVWFTDPPYYDAIPYADLADFFLVWLKRMLPDYTMLGDPFAPENQLSPKAQECVWNQAYEFEGRPKNAAFFETTISKAFQDGRRILSEDGIASIVFAHQTTQGWEAFLGGLVSAGWTVTASWPIATEMASRIRARDNASLATSVHLICRPRAKHAPVGDWADVLREFPERVADWMERLQTEGIRGADLVFACVGPALEVFSRYRAVETAEGRDVGLPEYLEKIWEVVGRTALENVLGTGEAKAHNGVMGVLEEDARLTALFLWTLQSTEVAGEKSEAKGEDEETVAKSAARGFSLPFDVVRRFAQPMGIDLDRWTDRIIGQEKGVVRLLPVTSRAAVLFGHEGAQAAADWIESDPAASLQQTLFPETEAPSKPVKRRHGKKSIIDESAELQSLEATALDRVHASMLLQSSGHSNALRKLIVAEQERGPEFLRLANALSALYPSGSDEKRLLDGMLLAVPR